MLAFNFYPLISESSAWIKKFPSLVASLSGKTKEPSSNDIQSRGSNL
jgi:hypothetical protein